MLWLALSGCIATTPPPAATSLVTNHTGDPELAALASATLAEQLKANGVRLETVELDARLDPTAEGGLRIQILCTSRGDHLLKASVEVKGHGAAPQRLIPSLMARAARELAVDCR